MSRCAASFYPCWPRGIHARSSPFPHTPLLAGLRRLVSLMRGSLAAEQAGEWADCMADHKSKWLVGCGTVPGGRSAGTLDLHLCACRSWAAAASGDAFMCANRTALRADAEIAWQTVQPVICFPAPLADPPGQVAMSPAPLYPTTGTRTSGRLLAQVATPANATKPANASRPAVAAAVPAKAANPTVAATQAAKAQPAKAQPAKAQPATATQKTLPTSTVAAKNTCSGGEWHWLLNWLVFATSLLRAWKSCPRQPVWHRVCGTDFIPPRPRMRTWWIENGNCSVPSSLPPTLALQ